MATMRGRRTETGRVQFFSPRELVRIAAAQARWAAEAAALGQQDAAAGMPARMNQSEAYRIAYTAQQAA